MLNFFNSICPPAKFYLILSIISYIISTIQSFGQGDLYCLGMFGCSAENGIYLHIFQIVYIAFWTWLLNIICRGGGTLFSWLLVLLPFILFFIIIAMSLFS